MSKRRRFSGELKAKIALEARPRPSIEILMPAACKRPGEGAARELAARVGVEDLRRAMAGQRVVEGFDAEARAEGVRQPPGQHLPGSPSPRSLRGTGTRSALGCR